MAYNPHSFESVYGFSMLDEIHNFFPEILYDDGIFPADNIRWMRHRIHHLFPQVYVRQQNMYNIYNAEPRLRSYVSWYRENARMDDMPNPEARLPVLIPSLATPPPPRHGVAPANGAGAARVDLSGAEPTPPPTIRRMVRQQSTTLPTLFTSLLWDIREPIAADTMSDNLLNILNQAFIDVTVAPTAVQIDHASTLRAADEISAETSCSVCQEHAGAGIWRILHCGHSYHQDCIDTWLASHVQCPICRTDVRTMRPPAQT
jgi:hypothetical protein